MKLRDSTRYNTSATRRLATAFTAALIGGAVLSTPAQAVTLADNDGLGDAVIYQYYTTKNGWRTFFRLLNTSNLPVVVKVRYREAANSREVLDFEVALSPQDMWAGWTDPNVTIAGTTGPGIKTGDTSCLFPLVGQSNPATEGFAVQADGTVGALFKDRAFTGDYDDNGPYPGDPTLRMGEGHFEIIGVTAAPAGSLFDLAVSHQSSDGEPENCSAAYTYYLSGNGGLGLDVPDALAANAYLVNINSGQGAGYDPNILATCRTTDIRALAVATDTTPDLDDCDAGNYGIQAIAIDGVNAYNGTYAVNQALWNGTTPPDVTQTIFQADVDGSGAITPVPLFNFDLNNDGFCNQPEEIGISEEDVDESIYDAVGLDPVGVIPTVAGGCDYRFGTSQTQGPGVTATLDVTSPGAWRIKQKGQVTYAPDPDVPLDLTNQYLVSGGVDWVSSLFMADTVINEWAASNNPGAIITDYFTQWVLTFPTKNYYVDLQDDVNLGDDISPTLARTVPATFAPFGNPPVGSSIFPGNGESCEPVSLFMYNREERFSAFTSPAPTPDNSLCWETNVVTFNQNYADAGLDSDFTFVIDELDLPTDFDGQTSERGWARMWFTGAGANTGLAIPTATPLPTPPFVWYGLPVTGFMFSIYETGDAATNHTTINAHKYERNFGQSQARPPRTN